MMEKWIADFPAQMQEALRIGETAKLKSRLFRPSEILVAGLGGSGIGAALISGLLKRELRIPLLVNQDYHLPGFVSESTLVIISSFSGNTEESLSMMDEAMERGAVVCAISSGGKVSEICQERGLNLIQLPPGQPPRTCLGYSLVSQLCMLHHYSLIGPEFKQEIQTVIEKLENQQPIIKEAGKEIAEQLAGSIPVLYSGSDWEAVTRRFRQQLNENSKMLCWNHSLPEMTHNELVGWDSGEEHLAVLFIQSEYDHPRIAKRIELTREIVSEKVKTVVDVKAKGANRWEQTFYLIHLLDWASFYLSEINQVDPIEIAVIDRLKQALAKIN